MDFIKIIPLCDATMAAIEKECNTMYMLGYRLIFVIREGIFTNLFFELDETKERA